MIELLAIAREDGWAYIRREDGTLSLVRPPYTNLSTLQAEEGAVEKALAVHGFSAASSQKEFTSLGELVSFLNREILESREAKGKPLPDAGLGKEMLELAPTEVVAGFLDRIERELLPQRRWDAAQDLLIAILHLPRLRTDPEIGARATDLLGRTTALEREAKEAKLVLAAAPVDLEAEFPLASRQHGAEKVAREARRISERHQILDPA